MYTLAQISDERAAVHAAIAKALLAQSYRSGAEGAERARLKELRDHLQFLDAQEAKLTGAGGGLTALSTRRRQ